MIVQSASLQGVAAAVQAVGGEVIHELGIVHAVGARLTPAQHEALRASAAVRRLYADRQVETAKRPLKTIPGFVSPSPPIHPTRFLITGSQKPKF